MSQIIYRISDAGYSKVKPAYINNENCLRNATAVFKDCKWWVIADNLSEISKEMLEKYIDVNSTEHVSVGHGAGTFNLALDYALKLDDETVVYFLENDYLHKPGAEVVLEEGFKLGADFVALYDHPDKYMDGVNPLVEDGGEITKVFLTNTCHWKLTNSTTMTFAAKVKTLKKYENVMRKWTNTTHPHDFEMWMELRNLGATLVTPLPGYATHGETAWLSPLTSWSLVC